MPWRDRRETNSPDHSIEELQHTIEVDAMRIDLGPEGKANVGDRATFATKFKRVGPSIMSKAIDDRIGIAILIELLKHAPKNIELCLSFSVQEEIGLRGAKVAAHYFEPDLAIAVDSTPARDLPDYEGKENFTYNTRLGFGPAIYMANSSTMDDPRLGALFGRDCREGKNSISIPSAWRRRHECGRNPAVARGRACGLGLCAASLHPFAHQHLAGGGLEKYVEFIACGVEEIKRGVKELAA